MNGRARALPAQAPEQRAGAEQGVGSPVPYSGAGANPAATLAASDRSCRALVPASSRIAACTRRAEIQQNRVSGAPAPRSSARFITRTAFGLARWLPIGSSGPHEAMDAPSRSSGNWGVICTRGSKVGTSFGFLVHYEGVARVVLAAVGLERSLVLKRRRDALASNHRCPNTAPMLVGACRSGNVRVGARRRLLKTSVSQA